MLHVSLKKTKSTTDKNPNYRIITIEQPSSIAAESYRRIRVSLEYAEVDKKIQVIQLCSSVQGEGKTTVALNLAATYAEDEKKIIVVDLDLRRPKIHRAFKIDNHNGTGLTDLLAGKVTKEEAIKHTETGIDVLNSGTKPSHPTTTLGSHNLAALFEELREEYDYIIVDCPPILSVSDAAIISKLTDGCIFIVSQSKTEKTAAKEAISNLKQNNVNVIGCVFTEIDPKHSEYYSSKYKYYYSSYYGKDKK